MQFSLLDFDIEQTYAGTQALHQKMKEKAKNLEDLWDTLSAVFLLQFQLKLRLLFLFLHAIDPLSVAIFWQGPVYHAAVEEGNCKVK